jgi:hypothetical protein
VALIDDGGGFGLQFGDAEMDATAHLLSVGRAKSRSTTLSQDKLVPSQISDVGGHSGAPSAPHSGTQLHLYKASNYLHV